MPELEDLLAEASARVHVEPPGSDAAVSTARTRRRRRTGVVGLLVVALLGGAAALVPVLDRDEAQQSVVPAGKGANPLDEVPPVSDIRLDASGAVLTSRYVVGACAGPERQELSQTSTEVRVRVVVAYVPPPQVCVASKLVRRATVRLSAPIGARRLVVVDGSGERVIRTGTGAAREGNVLRPVGLRTDPDGQGVLARYEVGACTGAVSWETVEGADEVRVRLVTGPGRLRGPNEACPSSLTSRQTGVRFVTPLGDRALVVDVPEGEEPLRPFAGERLRSIELPTGVVTEPSELGDADTWLRVWDQAPVAGCTASGRLSVEQGPDAGAVLDEGWERAGSRPVQGDTAELWTTPRYGGGQNWAVRLRSGRDRTAILGQELCNASGVPLNADDLSSIADTLSD